jgi:hypothetical protein
MSRSKLCENGPEIVEKKYNVAHSIHYVTPRNKKKVRSVRGTLGGVFRYYIKSYNEVNKLVRNKKLDFFKIKVDFQRRIKSQNYIFNLILFYKKKTKNRITVK